MRRELHVSWPEWQIKHERQNRCWRALCESSLNVSSRVTGTFPEMTIEELNNLSHRLWSTDIDVSLSFSIHVLH